MSLWSELETASSAGHLAVASKPIFEPKPTTGEAKSSESIGVCSINRVSRRGDM
ncbi:Uncharacterised protein [Vibrio cholerae]|nr:Uncharacterised protein [Vibrio cholerae]